MENKGGTFQINPYLCRAMPKKHLIISTSTELVRFVPDKIVYIKADGNYSKIHQVDGETKLIVFQLGKIEEAIDKQLGADGKPFARIGKSIIINCSFVYSINVPKKELVLSDMATFYHTLNPSEIALKELKKHIEVDKEKYYAKEL
jgi:DNA-binding LytR/AlgR family response regulator